MLFILGYISGILTATFIAVILTYFRRVIENKTTFIEKKIENAGPRPRGFIVPSRSDADIARDKIIAKNQALGKDTKLSELQ